jgi:hypothetical protein
MDGMGMTASRAWSLWSLQDARSKTSAVVAVLSSPSALPPPPDQRRGALICQTLRRSPEQFARFSPSDQGRRSAVAGVCQPDVRLCPSAVDPIPPAALGRVAHDSKPIFQRRS